MLMKSWIAAALLFVTPAAWAGSLDLKLRNPEGQEVLNKILDDQAFWSGA